MTTTTSPATTERATLEPLLATITAADAGDDAALARIRTMFRKAPALADHLSGLVWNAEAAILAGEPAGAVELLRQQSANLRRDLAMEGTGSALERMLIRRIGLDCMASLQADRAHRRFLASVEALARVRKLITPIQINIAQDGGQQVNLAGSGQCRQR